MMIVPANNVPHGYMELDRYDIVNHKKNAIQATVVQAVHPDLLDRVRALENHMGAKNLTQKSVVPLTLEKQIESLDSNEAKDALEAVEKELKRREFGNSDSWALSWLTSSSSSESSWGLGWVWNWLSSFIANLGNYNTETLQAARETLARKIEG